MAEVQVEELDKTCPECGSKIVLKTEKKFLRTKTWLECSECNKTWKNEKEYTKDFELKQEMKELEKIEQTGELPEIILVGGSIVLKKNEILHLHDEPVTLLEEKTRSYSYRSKSMGVRIKVAKGVYLTPRVGGGTFKQSETKIEPVDRGELYLTSNRLIFVGEKKTVGIPLKKIFAVEQFSDAIKIGREGKQKAEYFAVNNPLKWATFLRIAISKL